MYKLFYYIYITKKPRCWAEKYYLGNCKDHTQTVLPSLYHVECKKILIDVYVARKSRPEDINDFYANGFLYNTNITQCAAVALAFTIISMCEVNIYIYVRNKKDRILADTRSRYYTPVFFQGLWMQGLALTVSLEVYKKWLSTFWEHNISTMWTMGQDNKCFKNVLR